MDTIKWHQKQTFLKQITVSTVVVFFFIYISQFVKKIGTGCANKDYE